jgi:hypothetical protein
MNSGEELLGLGLGLQEGKKFRCVCCGRKERKRGKVSCVYVWREEKKAKERLG